MYHIITFFTFIYLIYFIYCYQTVYKCNKTMPYHTLIMVSIVAYRGAYTYRCVKYIIKLI